MKKSEILIGTDPEFFATIEEDGVPKAISPALLGYLGCIRQIGGTEKHPEFIETNEYVWHGDGVAFEVRFKKPFENGKKLAECLKDSLDHLQEFLSFTTYSGQKVNLFRRPVVDINLGLYQPFLKIPEIYQGFIFGCDRDYDAIDTSYECVTIDARTHPFRYAGGHAHFSILNDERFIEFPQVAIQLLAIYFGNAFVHFTPFRDDDLKRVQTYGRPGRYRPQPYPNNFFGIEYRSPSNSWASLSNEVIDYMFDLGKQALTLFDDEEKIIKTINDYLPQTIDAIINSDKDLADQILLDLGVV